MPQWTDEGGNDLFGKLECKRCLQVFDTDKAGEIPKHKCIGGMYASRTYINKYGDVESHIPIFISQK